MSASRRRAALRDPRSALVEAGTDFYRDLDLERVLDGVLTHSRRLLGGVAGSVSVLDLAAGVYTKVAESGAPCRLGQTFALDEGVTGRVLARRAPVLLSRYRDLPTAHLRPEDPVGDGAVVAVPIWWRGDVAGVNVVFAGRRRRFGAGEVDALEALTQSGAAALVTSWSCVTTGGQPRAGSAGRRPAAAELTPRELQVLELLTEGLGDRQVARRLAVSVKTVEKHVGAVLRKTGTTNRTAAVVHALSNGLVGGEPGSRAG